MMLSLIYEYFHYMTIKMTETNRIIVNLFCTSKQNAHNAVRLFDFCDSSIVICEKHTSIITLHIDGYIKNFILF